MQLPFISRKAHERGAAQIQEQYGIRLSALEEENKTFQADYGRAINQFKAETINYIASQVNYAQFQYQDYTLARLLTELYLKDSVVSACISAWQLHYPEPFKIFYKGEVEQKNTPLTKLIQNPNPWMTESAFDRYMVTYQLWTGNCYALKIYEDNGDIAQLFPFSGLNIYPVPHYDEFIGHYNFVTAEGIISRIEPEKIIHFPWFSIDPRRLFMGISPLQLAARDIQVSILLTEMMGNYLKNMPMPSYIMQREASKDGSIEIDGSSLVSNDVQSAEGIKQTIKERYSGGNIGDPAVLQNGWKMDLLAIPLKDLNIEHTVKTHQCNICANFKTDPEFIKVIAGQQGSTYDNQQTSKLNFFQGALTSLWVQNSDQLTNGLKREFGEDILIKYDISKVGVLKDFRSKDMGRFSEAILTSQKDYFDNPSPEKRSGCIATIVLLTGVEEREVEPLFPEMKKPVAMPSQAPLDLSRSAIDDDGKIVDDESKAFLSRMEAGLYE